MTTKEVGYRKICDNCKKTVEVEDEYDIPSKWYSLPNIDLYFNNTKKATDSVSGKNSFEYSDCNDPDFCSRVCLDAWFKKEVDRITKA